MTRNNVILVFGILPLAAFAQPSNSVTITDQSGSAQPNRPFTISRVFAKGDIPHCAQAVVAGVTVPTQCDAKTRWPDNSLQHAMISFVANLSANGSLTVSFVDQATGNNTGALTKAQMLAANWGAEIDVTNGTTLTANARQIVTDWTGSTSDPRVTYWLQGPLCTQVILEDRSTALAYDMGWDSYKPLHPIFVATFYAGFPGVKVEMILENDWTTKLEDQTYTLALKLGNPLGSPVYTKSNYTHTAQSRWRKTFWSGTQPGAVNINFNLPYMIYSQVVPNWDLTKTASVAGDVNNFNNSDKGDLGGHALWTQYEPQTGGRPDLGVFPAWYVRYLYTMDYNGYKMVLGMAEVAGYVPLHYRESLTGRYFDSKHTVAAFGYPLSIDARPSYTPLANQASTTPSDKINPVGTTTTAGWAVDMAHTPGMVYIPYLITGDWYFLEELQFAASRWVPQGDPSFIYYGRGGSWGFLPFALQTRGQAWGLRDVIHSAFTSPDGTPQKAYYTEKLNNNIAVEEGQHNVKNGAFTPTDTTCPGGATSNPWCYGNKTIGHFPNPLQFWGWADPGDCNDPHFVASSDPYACWADGTPFEYGYKMNVFGHAQELGFKFAALNQSLFVNMLHMIQDPGFNPFLLGAYRIAMVRNTTNQYYQTWGDTLNAYTTTWNDGCGHTYNLRTINVWPETCGGSGDNNVSAPGYPHIMKGAASYLAGLNINDGPLLGVNAWNWMVANVGFQNSVGVNPQYVILPRTVTTGTQASQCDLNSDGVVDVQDVQLSINKALGVTTCGNGDLVGNGTCNVVDVQRVINAALGNSCRLGP